VVYLGSSIRLEEPALDFNVLRSSTFLYFTGYQYETESLRVVITAAAEYCKRTLTQVVMDLADPGIVERNRDGLRDFIREYVDIVVANETEGASYCEGTDRECVQALGADSEYAILKLGAEGSLIKHYDTVVTVPPVKTEAVDTTGAGDMYAAGILVGLDRGYSLEYTGRIGSYAASLIIARKGARLDHDIAREIEDL
jgi:sugar/nucleoside kinase (ribokinase family)